MNSAASTGPGRALGEVGSSLPTAIYGAAHFSKSLFWYGGEILFAYFLTETVGLSALEMGTVLALGLAASALCDLCVGQMLRGHLSEAADAARLQALGAIVSAAMLMAFLATSYVPEPFTFVYGMAAGVAFRAAYAIFDVSQNCLMALTTASARGRARLSAIRMWFSGLATLLVAGAIAPLIAAQAAGAGAGIFLDLGFIASGFAVTSAVVLRIVIGAPRARPCSAPTHAVGDIGWTLLLVLAVVTSVFPPVFTKLEPYFAHYVMGSALQGSGIAMAAAIGVLIAQPVWARLAVRLDQRAALALAALVQGTGALLFVAAPQPDLVAALAGALLFGAGNGAIGMIMWAMLSDTAAHSRPDRNGWRFALFTATSKISLAIGGVVIAAVLAGTDFREVDRAVIPLTMAAGPIIGSLLVLTICTVLQPGPRRKFSAATAAPDVANV